MALKIKYQVDSVIGDPWTYSESFRPSQRLDSAYAILYFFGTLEILIWSVLGILKAKKANESGRTQLLLLLLITFPFLLRSSYTMGGTIHDELLGKPGTKHLYLATEIIYNLTTLAIYAGLVAIGRHFATATPFSYDTTTHTNHSYTPNNPWPGPGLPPTKPNMAVHEGGAPLYHQGTFQPTPYTTPHQQQHQQPQQQIPYQLQHPYPNQPLYHQGYQPYPLYQQQQQQQPAHPHPHSQPQMNPVSPNGTSAYTATTATELPSPTGTPHPGGR
ncbi:MAG: hypothetical protein Q9182_007318 [Xanthomendoza sp. 2 TL-2023]